MGKYPGGAGVSSHLLRAEALGIGCHRRSEMEPISDGTGRLSMANSELVMFSLSGAGVRPSARLYIAHVSRMPRGRMTYCPWRARRHYTWALRSVACTAYQGVHRMMRNIAVSTSLNPNSSTILSSAEMTALDLIDASAVDSVVVYGSLPPHGRDLDLLARPAELDAIRMALVGAGFLSGNGLLVGFRADRTEAVELTPISAWGLSPRELANLFAEARPIDGAQRLVRPAPWHMLLITARRVARKRTLPDKLRARVANALAEEPDAWRVAHERAAGWGAARALRMLENAYQGDGHIPAMARWRAVGERIGLPGTRPLRTQARMALSLLTRPHRTHVVTLSGLDGAGKSSQAALIKSALEVAGRDVVVIWRGIGAERTVDRVKAPIKRLLHRLPRVGPWAEVVDRVKTEGSTGRTPFADPGASKRSRSKSVSFVTYVWASTVAAINVWTLYSAALPHFGRGRVIIFDRYTLDSTVKLKHFYGDNAATRLLAHLIHYATIRPIRAYLLDVPPQVAYDRKPEWEIEDLEARAALYQAEYAWLHVQRLDATRPTHELGAEIAADIWRALTHERA